MPKRSSEEKIEHYRKKIRKLENKQFSRIRKLSSSDSDQDSNRDNAITEPEKIGPDPEMPILDTAIPPMENTIIPAMSAPAAPELSAVTPVTATEQADNDSTASTEQGTPVPTDLDPSILAALGEITDEAPEFGEKIHDNLAKIWMPILKKGMSKENREALLKKYLIPENCRLLQAPILNPEIQAAIPDSGKFRDKKMSNSQQQLGSGITAINRGLNLLVSNENKVDAIKFISDGCRLLSDLHHQTTETRIKFITPCLDKTFLQVVDQSERDNTLFGNNLSEKIKASKAITRQGQQIKKTSSTTKPSTSSVQNTSRPNFQGNWQTPSRFQANRGGRGGYKRTNQRTPIPSQPRTSNTSSNSKPRAPRRQ